MLITREMDYAVRILRALHRGAPLTTPEIMAQEHLQQAITYKLMKKLSRAGLVKGQRGKVGGYMLLRDCGELTLYDLFLATEGPLYVTECLEMGYSCENNDCGQCLVHKEFARIQGAMNEELKKTRLSELF